MCFFFQAEDGIRDVAVTGVQTCALPISAGADTWGSALVGTPVGMTAAVDCTPPLTAARASPLVTRPSLPEPATLAADRLFSASSLAAAGMATSPLLPPVAAAAAGGAPRARGR